MVSEIFASIFTEVNVQLLTAEVTFTEYFQLLTENCSIMVENSEGRLSFGQIRTPRDHTITTTSLP